MWSYVTHLESLGLTHLKAADLALAFQAVRTGAVRQVVPFPTICTHNGSTRVCWIFQHLALWNKLLWAAMAELREVRPGRLAFVSQHFLRLAEETCPYQLEYTYALIHCLLANHRCVVSVIVDSEVLQAYPALFSDALRRNTSLEQLRIDTPGMEFDEVGELIVDVCANCRLRELVCSEGRLLGSGSEVQARFAEFLKRSTTLRVLSITNISLHSNCEFVLGPLQENSTVTRLTIDSACIELDNGASLFKFLSANSVLVELTVVKQTWCGSCNVGLLFKSLETNHVLRKLCLQRFSFTMDNTISMADALTVNTALQELDISNIEYTFIRPWLGVAGESDSVTKAKSMWGNLWRVQPFVNAVRNSISLRRLLFGHVYFRDDELRSLLTAVRESHSLHQIQFLQVTCSGFCEFVKLVEETDTFDKVAIRHCYSNASLFADSLRTCESLPLTGSYSFRFLNTTHLREICSALILNDSITSINLCADRQFLEMFDEQCAESLASYVSSTTALKELHVAISSVDKSVNRIVLAGLSANTTIERLEIFSGALYDSDVRMFAKWIQQSKTLYELSASFVPDNASALFLSELFSGLQDCYTLTSLSNARFEYSQAHWQVIQDLLSRNSSLTMRAVHFAMGSTLKRCATAFERVSWHPLVYYRLAQTMPLDEARQKLEASKKRLLMDFWQLTGVVKEDLCCHKCNDGRLQIDELSFDAWMAVRKFLKVGDVLDASCV